MRDEAEVSIPENISHPGKHDLWLENNLKVFLSKLRFFTHPENIQKAINQKYKKGKNNP